MLVFFIAKRQQIRYINRYAKEKECVIMPQNQLQRTVFAFLTVVITVHAYVFYSL